MGGDLKGPPSHRRQTRHSLSQWFPTWVPRTMFRGSAGFFDESMYVRKYLKHLEIVINIILGICIAN